MKNNDLEKSDQRKKKSDHAVRVSDFKSDLFVDRMKTVIDRLGSVAEAARKAGVKEGTVRSWRDGNTDPQRKHLVALANAAGVEISWLAAGVGDMVNQVADDSPAYGVQDRDNYLKALQMLEEVLRAANVDLTPSKKVQAVEIIAGMIEREDESVLQGNIVQLVKLAS